MRCVLMFVAFLLSSSASSVFGGEYVLDISRLSVVSDRKSDLADDPKSFTTESIEIDITEGEDFRTRLRTDEKILTVKGRLTKTEKGVHILEISVEYLGDVKDPDALTGIEDKLRCQTQVGVVPGKASSLGGALSRTESSAQGAIKRTDVICVRIDERPKDSETDASRRKDLKSQHAELLKKALETDFKDLP